ncbi:FK506 binding protein 11 [Willisornis vidua]|uniref:peptidylprolyl isomerase n=1 Tax=Willisornis vidua TaxID=1566151 RepID=A0ABQ9DNV2_9PASS|nr:FK506 binding protein 11 [Willisornis vidua]
MPSSGSCTGATTGVNGATTRPGAAPGPVPPLRATGPSPLARGLEQSLLDMCVGEKRRAIIPPHLAYGKRGSPPTIPGDAVLRFEVELVGLSRASYWQKVVNDVVPLLCLGLVPALLGLIGFHLYRKASSPKLSKKKLKEEKRNKAKKK